MFVALHFSLLDTLKKCNVMCKCVLLLAIALLVIEAGIGL